MTAPEDRKALVELMARAYERAAKLKIGLGTRVVLEGRFEAVLDALEAAGCTVVPNEATEEMQIAGGLGVRMRYIDKDKLNAAIAASPLRRKP